MYEGKALFGPGPGNFVEVLGSYVMVPISFIMVHKMLMIFFTEFDNCIQFFPKWSAEILF